MCQVKASPAIRELRLVRVPSAVLSSMSTRARVVGRPGLPLPV